MHEELIAGLDAAPADVVRALRRARDACLGGAAEGIWGPSQIVGHMVASDAILAPRVLQILVRPGVDLPGFDERRWQEVLEGAGLSIAELVRLYVRRRAELVMVLRRLDAPTWDQSGVHEEWGVTSIERICRHLATHEAEHLVQLRAATEGELASRGRGPATAARARAVARYSATLPERVARATFAAAGGAAHETGALLLPRMVRRSRFYEVTAKNALRIAIELVGGVEGHGAGPGSGTAAGAEPAVPSAGRIAVKKAAGNVVEIGSIAAFGFSPLWLLAGASDILNGTRVYLRTLEGELSRAGYLQDDVHFESVDALLGALQGASGTTAGAIDTPPIEIAELRTSLGELRENAQSLPKPSELASLFNGLVRTARAESRPLLEVSAGIGLAFVTSAKHVTNDHLVAPYREDWRPLRREGFGAYAARVSGPYRRAVGERIDPARGTWTEKGASWIGRQVWRLRR